MYVVYAILATGAVCVAFFIFLFIGGALVGLGSVGKQALRVNRTSQDAKVEVPEPKAVARPASLAHTVKGEPLVDVGGAYAAA